VKISELASRNNLQLAWKRISTGGNFQYKRLYRQLYYSYEIALENNLSNLGERLRGGSYKAFTPERIFIPKPSGLHRPITLLHIEDQILLQAFANLAAKRIQKRRSVLQLKSIYSNILQKKDSIFFFRKWRSTYAAFQQKIRENYQQGMHWVGDFDLAAFYDTISHQLLIKTIYPRTNNADLSWFLECLRVWSSHAQATNHGHGLPQGPLASDFLAECFLLPIDIELKEARGYLRYVDDVRLQDVRQQLIQLELLCKARGLIPQVGKFALKKVKSVEEAMGMLPSISDPQHEESGLGLVGKEEARQIFGMAIGGRPLRVIDKTRLKFILYRAPADTKILKHVLALAPRHPEYADVFFSYLARFRFRKPIERLCMEMVRSYPYSYIRGEAWHLLARYVLESKSHISQYPKEFITRAISVARNQSKNYFHEKWGACHFLCKCELGSGRQLSKFVAYQPALLQALVAHSLPESAYIQGDVIAKFLQRSAPEPGLSVCAGMHQVGIAPATYGVADMDLPSQVINTLHELGLLSDIPDDIDPIAEILRSRYNTHSSKSWKELLGSEYKHALGLLKQAEASFHSGPSHWLALQNSFNHAIFIALQTHFASIGHPGRCSVIGQNGHLVNFGSALSPQGPFSKECSAIADGFRHINIRRNHLPASHPYEQRTGEQTKLLKSSERNGLMARLQSSYNAFVVLMP
jgi:hypothetical protein